MFIPLPSVCVHMWSRSRSDSAYSCCRSRLVMMDLLASVSGSGMYSRFTNRRLAASSISCGLLLTQKGSF
ncbi:hypothetical protein DPMN_153376 [Dreissena polymorpha]|uniref:Uncharacterized protein n=1 Tax=Dreissena polymorpha TaxID=45954 RepID=A0A9D4J4R8_DREPO|nr:hypothetical protein DPMN_153376 [Dreissena polymorpha]